MQDKDNRRQRKSRVLFFSENRSCSSVKGLRKIKFRIQAPGFGSGLFDLSSAKPQE